MAVINYTEEEDVRGALIITWAGLGNGDTGSPYKAPNYPDKCVQVTSVFGVGGTIQIEGTNDTGGSPVYNVLKAPDSNTLGFPAAAIEQILENSFLIRPRVTAGDGSTSLVVKMVATTVGRG